MKPHPCNRFISLPIATLATGLLLACAASTISAADRWWDTGTVDIATNGDGASGNASGAAALGTWNTTIKNWDQGAGLAHLAWDNGAIDTAIFGGTQANTIRVITLGSSMTVKQIRIITGSTGNFRYDIGVAADTTNAITFGGPPYSDALPQIDASGAGNNNFPAKVTGDYTASGGLFITHGSNITTPGSSGRFALTNTGCDFVGDMVMLSGNLSIGTQLGNAANKLVLKGGALFISGGSAVTSVFARAIHVASNSGLATNAATAGLQVMDLTGAITGSAELTRYVAVAGSASSEVRFSGDMSGYSGTFVQNGPSATSIATIQTTVQSSGAWKVNSGTLKLNTTTTDTAIANGTGKADLILNAGTLDLNGKSETINGLSSTSAGGIVQNSLSATTATLTLGDADATGTFAGTLRDNAGGAATGKLALTKIGAGSQTITGGATYTGATAVNGGTLVLPTASTPPVTGSAVTVADNATLGITLKGAGQSLTVDSLATGAGAGSTLVLDGKGFGLSEFPMVDCLGPLDPGTGATTLVKLKGYDFATGTYPLLGYATLGGAGFAGFDKLLPYRVVGTLVDNTVGKSIDLNITSAETAVWKGEAGGVANGTWDIDPEGAGASGTMNWKTSVAGTATRYAQGSVNTDQVTFDDTLSPIGTATVNLTTTLTPRHTRVKNDTTTYTFTGSGKLSGETLLEKAGTGTLILANTGVNDHTGGTLIAEGMLQLGDGTTPGVGRLAGPVDNSGVLAFSHLEPVTFGQVISGSSGSVLKMGSNPLALTATNTYGGGTTVRGGILAAAVNTAMGTGEVQLGDATSGSATLEIVLENRADVANAIWVSPDATGTATLAASNTGTGTGNPASFTGTVTLDRDATFRNDIAGDRLAFTGRITGTITEPATTPTPVVLTLSGRQNVTLQNTANDFAGSIRVTGAGTVLQASANTAPEVIPDAVSVDLAADTWLKLYSNGGNQVETIATLTGTGSVARHESATTGQILAVGSGGASSAFDGVIRNTPGTGTGTMGLKKIGAGTFTLGNTNTYTGTTTVEGGTLVVNGSIAGSTNVTGGTLAGTGTVRAVVATSTGVVSPGTDATIGTLSAIGNVSFVSTCQYLTQINSSGTPSSDCLAVTGNLALGDAILTVTDLGTAALSSTTRLILATYSGTLTGTFKDSNGATIAEGADITVGSNTYKIKYADPEGAGMAITLSYSAAGGYAAWATAQGVGAADADHDADGVENGVEYVLGTDPKAATSTGITTTVTDTEFKFEFARSDAAETPDTALSVEVSGDLGTWTANGSPHAVGPVSSGSVTVIENPADPGADPGTDRIILTVPRDSAVKFARIRVVVSGS
jgi:autotransporter-associated beta strand protein